jgi:hypothetical protein
MSNPVQHKKGICHCTRIHDALTIKSLDVKRAIHSLHAVKSNEQRQQEITGLTSL